MATAEAVPSYPGSLPPAIRNGMPVGRPARVDKIVVEGLLARHSAAVKVDHTQLLQIVFAQVGDLNAGPGPTKSRATIRTRLPHCGWSLILGW